MNTELLKVPPHSLEAERAVLSAMLVSGQSAALAFNLAPPEAFYGYSERAVAKICYDCFKNGQQIDIVTVHEEVKKRKDKVTLDFLASLAENMIAPYHVEEHAKIVYDKWCQRKLIEIGTQAVNDAYETGCDPQATSVDVQKKLMEINQQKKSKNSMELLSTLAGDGLKMIEHNIQHKNPLYGLSTGLTKLDEWTGGLNKGEMIVIAARPAMGKSSLALQIFLDNAIKHEKSGIFFSIEMPREMMIYRIYSSLTGIPYHNLRIGMVSDEQKLGLINQHGLLYKTHAALDTDTSATIIDIRMRILKHKFEHGLDLLVFDYLQLMATEGVYKGQRVQEIRELSGGLKKLAKEFDVPVLVVSQLSRRPEMRDNPEPMLADLRESGDIEQDTDMAWGIWCDKKEWEAEREREKVSFDEKSKPKQRLLTVMKSRNNPIGRMGLLFNPKSMRFVEPETHRDFPEEE